MNANELNRELDKIERKQEMFRRTGNLSYLRKANWLIEELLNELDEDAKKHRISQEEHR